ncbi:hypothetical protein D9758_010885 [Tetrapyrgos nigripes]|uniref:Lysine-specific metallo-endopeptidase domain-containing protein n=1 Tax=Tetrapyrgos nigripes TaxID=182062 RepID=A0A8H5FTA4_9AGAR|nr:hypothetical protein D9758_010885 [Tetrapyrgos nigripes]
MFSSTLRSTLIALCFSAVLVSAASELTLKVTGPEAVTNVDNFKVTTLLTNSGDETLHLLNDPTSSLISSNTDSFHITNSDGASPAFNGARFKFSPAVAARMNTSDVITIIPPGQSIKVEHDLSSAYNFTSSGEDVYDIEASNKFFVVDPATLDVTQIYAKQESSHQAKLSGTLSIARRTTSLAKRANFNGCSADQQSNINNAIPAALTYASDARDYLRNHASSTDRYTHWFGTYNDARHSAILTHFTNMAGHGYNDYKYDCTCPEGRPGDFAYVYTDDISTMYLCRQFWRAANTGEDSRAGTLVHESSHYDQLAGTDDYTYGHVNCEALAQQYPDAAALNADSHEYFAENVNPTLN